MHEVADSMSIRQQMVLDLNLANGPYRHLNLSTINARASGTPGSLALRSFSPSTYDALEQKSSDQILVRMERETQDPVSIFPPPPYCDADLKTYHLLLHSYWRDTVAVRECSGVGPRDLQEPVHLHNGIGKEMNRSSESGHKKIPQGMVSWPTTLRKTH